MSRFTKNNDPRQLTVKYSCKCSKCKTFLAKGTSAYYWPSSRQMVCLACGETDYRKFLEAVQDEEIYNSWY